MTSDAHIIDKSEAPRNLIAQLRSQSTIYRRHEARLARSSALKDDTRPAAVRVLSGLPGFRMVFEPYRPASAGKVPPESPTFAFSEDTVYSNGSPHKTAQENQVSPNTPLKVVSAAGIGGAVSELVFGNLTKVSIHRNTVAAYSKGASPFNAVQSDNGMLAYSEAASTGKSKFSLMPMHRSVTLTQVASGAAFAGLLFGTKSYVDTKFENEGTSLSFLASSASAGVAVATVLTPLQAVRSHMMLQQTVGPMSSQSLLQGSLSLLRSNGVSSFYQGARTVYAREIISATMYFATYELVKDHLCQKNGKIQQRASNLVIATSGAIAGSLYRSVVFAFDTANVYGLHLSRGLIPAVLRAAPANALLFLGYESALRYMPATRQSD